MTKFVVGQDEGLYSWLAVNYALGYIGNKPHETAGVIVLGKSAMQVLPFHPLLSLTSWIFPSFPLSLLWQLSIYAHMKKNLLMLKEVFRFMLVEG